MCPLRRVVKKDAMSQITESLYEGHFTILDIILHGELMDIGVLLVSFSVFLILVGRRGMRTLLTQGIFTTADVFLLLILIALPVLHALESLPIQYLVLVGGGVDADMPLRISLGRVSIYSRFALLALGLILFATLVQYVVRAVRRRAENVG